MGKAKSIKYEDFKKGNFKKIGNKSKDHPVLIFLRKKKKAYNIPAIIVATGMKQQTIRSMLRVLMKKGLVIHKTPYFAYKR